MKNKKTGRLDAVKGVLARFRFDAEFTAIEIGHLVNFPAVEVARDLVALTNKGEIALIGKRKKPEGGHDINVYQRIKKIEFSFTPNLAWGVWQDLFMIPIPVRNGMGRVYQMEA